MKKSKEEKRIEMWKRIVAYMFFTFVIIGLIIIVMPTTSTPNLEDKDFYEIKVFCKDDLDGKNYDSNKTYIFTIKNDVIFIGNITQRIKEVPGCKAIEVEGG